MKASLHLLSRIVSPGEHHPVYYDARWVDGGSHASPYLLGFGKFLSNFCVFFQRFYQTFVGLLIICLQVVTSETNVEVLAINLAHKCASLEDAASKTLRASKLEKEIRSFGKDVVEERHLKDGAISKAKDVVTKATQLSSRSIEVESLPNIPGRRS